TAAALAELAAAVADVAVAVWLVAVDAAPPLPVGPLVAALFDPREAGGVAWIAEPFGTITGSPGCANTAISAVAPICM
ncbi:hypothetical protein RNI00_30505, partial [Pseudomonas aeruginosa]|uniref:hypothetical protein n=1 Tax=Pseudomonas aeruginosa TaxID=287 RepID=UPI002884883F